MQAHISLIDWNCLHFYLHAFPELSVRPSARIKKQTCALLFSVSCNSISMNFFIDIENKLQQNLLLFSLLLTYAVNCIRVIK